MKYGRDIRKPSDKICIVTKNFAAISTAEKFSNFYLKSKPNNFDWDLAPSSPCKKLVNALADEKNFVKLIHQSLDAHFSLFPDDKKIIDEYNFYEIFTYWQKLFGNDMENGKKSSEYFITDIEAGRSSLLNDKSVIFCMSRGETKEKFIKVSDYKSEKAVDYLHRIVKFDKNFRIWDMAADTGNLEFALPAEWLKFTYISTLLDADYGKKIFKGKRIYMLK